MTSKPASSVNLFITCMADLFYPEIGERLVCLLERLGCEVRFPAAQTCCGQPAFNSGYPDAARTVAEHFVDVFAATRGPIVAPFGSCVHMVRHNSAALCDGDPQRRRAAEEIAARTHDFCDFVVNVLGRDQVGGRSPTRDVRRVAYHDECHMAHGLGVRAEPRKLLRGVAGVELAEIEGDELCCGFGGTFSVKLPEVSAAMADDKIDRYLEAGVDAVVSTDVGCLMHLEGRVRRRGDALRVFHLLDLLEPEGRL